MKQDAIKNLSEEEKIRIQSVPMLASINWLMEDDKAEDSLKWFSEFKKLSLAIQHGLADERIAKAILNFSRKYNVYNKEYIGEISRIIRDVYSKGIKENDIKKRMGEKLKIKPEMLFLAMEDFKKIILIVKEFGFQKEKHYEEKKAELYEEIDIASAIKKYHSVEDQQLSSSMIKLEAVNKPVRPSIKNWLEDYREKAGGRDRTSMQRSYYLFNTENTRGLSAIERQRLADLIESYDEGRKLNVNKEEGEIEFKKKDLLEEGIENEQQVADLINYSSKKEKNIPQDDSSGTIDLREVSFKEDKSPYQEKRRESSFQQNPSVKEGRNVLDLSKEDF